MRISKRAGLLLVLALAACARDADGPANEGAETNAADPAAIQPLEPANAVTPSPAPPAEAATIPAALHGRWGLVAGDCTTTRGDDKGLVTISADQIRFYESVAKPAKVTERTDSKIGGEFNFTGEGMEWTKAMIWSAAGDKLTRVDSEEDSRLVYTRC